jgi:iron complex outermembrane receptor protein
MGKYMSNNQINKSVPCFKRALISSIIAMNIMGVNAQEVSEVTDESADVEIITVTGIRDSYRNAINAKRESINIVDSISLKDIGALPDNSVAETLERITGVSADRFKGSASEISIRGLGPFLGMSTMNGRAISSGSGNRSVAFSQFPSELVSGVSVYKSQSANLLEGGVSGTIELGTIRPIDYGKQRFQAEVKGVYSDYQDKQDGHNGLGHKKSFSYVNSFDLDGGEFGFAIGYAGGKGAKPEETYLTSSTLRNCNSDYANDGGSNCSFKDTNAAANGGAAIDGDYYYIPNSFAYRQLESIEDKDAVIAAIQWKPTDSLDINIDGQWSQKYYFEDRHDLTFDDGRRRITNWTTNEDHVLTSYTGESRIGNTNEMRVRDEIYKGAGLNVKWQANDDLALTFDAAYSGTNRWQERDTARFRSDRDFYDWQTRGADTFSDVSNYYSDLNDPQGSAIDWKNSIKDFSFFNADSEARRYRFDIDDQVRSAKLDAKYLVDTGIFSYLSAGIAYSSRTHENYGEERVTVKTSKSSVADTLAAVGESCAETFSQKDYGKDGDSPATEWAAIDTICANNFMWADSGLAPDPKAASSNDIDLTEEITSVYVMTDFESELGDMYLKGNFGVRYVQTDITSIGVQQAYTTSTDSNGFIELTGSEAFETYTFNNSFNNVLPSLNVILELQEDLELRFAAYQAVSRPDMWFYGAGRDVSDIEYDQEYTSIEEALNDGNVKAKGNPELELVESDNYELGVNWYFEEDTMFSAAYYYKNFSARFGADTSIENVVINDESYQTTVQGLPTIFNEESSIQGVEFTALHSFKNLPAPFDGLGLSVSYNYADSDYETPESGGSISQEAKDVLEPGNLPGLSQHVGNAQVYWEGDAASVRLSYKYRSEYLKPFGSSLAQTNRYVADQKSFDLSLGYKISKNLKAKLQVLNLTNEPAVQQRVAQDNFSQIEYSGPTVFFGVKYRM